MKLSRITYGVTLNLGNYSSEKIEFEYSADPEESLDSEAVLKLAQAEIKKSSAYSKLKKEN